MTKEGAQFRSLAKPAYAGKSLPKLAGPRSLRDWVEVSWFFPTGFNFSHAIETPASLVAVGEEGAYKFAKPFLEPEVLSPAVFLERAERLRAEAQLNQPFAEDLYESFSIIEWVDGEPAWLDEFSLRNFDERIKPYLGRVGLEPALFLRKLRDNQSLREVLRKTRAGTRQDSLVQPVTESLSKFYASSKPEADTRLFPRWLWSRVNEVFSPVYATKVSYLDSFSQILFGETKAFIERSLVELESELIDRARRGLVVKTHGRLRLSNIYPGPIIKGRYYSLSADVLRDLASLKVDCLRFGLHGAASSFEKAWCPDSLSEQVLSLLCAVEALERFLERFLPEQASDRDLFESQKFLSLAYQFTLKFPLPFLVILTGVDERYLAQVGESLQQLVPATLVSRSGDESFSEFGSELTQFSRLLDRIESTLKRKDSVIAVWPTETYAQRKLLELASSFESGSELRVLFCSGETTSSPVDSTLRYTLLEPSLGRAELVRTVVRELERLN